MQLDSWLCSSENSFVCGTNRLLPRSGESHPTPCMWGEFVCWCTIWPLVSVLWMWFVTLVVEAKHQPYSREGEILLHRFFTNRRGNLISSLFSVSAREFAICMGQSVCFAICGQMFDRLSSASPAFRLIGNGIPIVDRWKTTPKRRSHGQDQRFGLSACSPSA